MVQLCSQLSQVRQHLEGGNGTKLLLNERDVVKNLKAPKREAGLTGKNAWKRPLTTV